MLAKHETRDDPRQAESRIDPALAFHKIEAGFASRMRRTPGADPPSPSIIAVRR